jgi:hypothetical protein
MDWKNASKQEINKMTYEQAREIVQRQIALGYTSDQAWKPRMHLTKALEIVLKQADAKQAN